MKIKLETIDQELTFQQARDLYNELKAEFEPIAYIEPYDSPPFFPDLHQTDVRYGPGTLETSPSVPSYHDLTYKGPISC